MMEGIVKRVIDHNFQRPMAKQKFTTLLTTFGPKRLKMK
jgi:hypothetical protein